MFEKCYIKKDNAHSSSADLKKTLAVLLDNIMLRLSKLESKVENIYNSTGGNLTNGASTTTPSSTNPEKVNVAGESYLTASVWPCRGSIGPDLIPFTLQESFYDFSLISLSVFRG